MSVSLSVCLSASMEHLGYHRMGFHEICYFSIFRKSVKKIDVSLKSDDNGTAHKDQHIFLISCSVLLRMRNVSHKSHKEIRNTHFVFKNFFRKSWHLWDNVEKFCRAGEAKYCNMGLVHCMQHNYSYKHNLWLHSTYCFYPATTVAQMHLNAVSYVHCLSRYSQILVTDSFFSSPKVLLFPL